MNGVWRFLHFLSFTLWIGGGLSVMVAGIAMKKMDRSVWGGVVDAQAAIYRILIGPGAIIACVSGLILTMEMYNSLSMKVGPWLGMMQGTGIIAALVILLGSIPAVGKLSRLDPVGPDAAHFDMLRKRLAVTSMLWGALSLIALLAGALYRAV
jgi:hypothetical protein